MRALTCTTTVLLAAVFAGCGSDDPLPMDLADTGLYADVAAGVLADGVRPFAPAFPLWTDGADKDRFILLPEGGVIDSSDMDHWRFPVGTKLFKRFTRDGQRVETRLSHVTEDGVELGTYVWQADLSGATLETGGVDNAVGTQHDVPDGLQCEVCHVGEPGRVLGFSALQLSSDAQLDAFTAEGWFSDPPVSGGYAPPGTPEVAAALGYMHSNCATCHVEGTDAYVETDMNLRLSVQDDDPRMTRAFTSNVGEPLSAWSRPDYATRVVAGAPDESGLYVRMTLRTKAGMPPLGTEEVDDDGLALVRRWIEGMQQ